MSKAYSDKPLPDFGFAQDHQPGHVGAVDPSVFGSDYGLLPGWALEYEAAPQARTLEPQVRPLTSVPSPDSCMLGVALLILLLAGVRRHG